MSFKAGRIDVRDARRRHQQPPSLGPPYWDDEHNAYAGKLLFAADALLLGQGDVAAAVAELKQQHGQDILKFGTGVLDHTLIEHYGPK